MSSSGRDHPPGPVLTGLTVAGEHLGWQSAGFTVGPDGRVGIGHVTILVDPSRPRRAAWSFRGTGPAALDGVPTSWAETQPPGTGPHRNGAELIDHVVVLTPDVDRTVAAYAGVGLSVRRIRHTGQYGPPFRQTFFRAGEVVIELIGPDTPDDDGPGRLYGIACTVTDLDATLETLGAHAGRAKDAVQPGRRIATLRTRELGIGLAIAFMSREAPASNVSR